MPSFLSSTVLLAMCLMLASADDTPSRVDRLQSIRAEYAKAREDFGKAIQAGTIKPNEDGEYPGWAEVIKRFAKPARALIEADPTDTDQTNNNPQQHLIAHDPGETVDKLPAR